MLVWLTNLFSIGRCPVIFSLGFCRCHLLPTTTTTTATIAFATNTSAGAAAAAVVILASLVRLENGNSHENELE